MNLKLELDKRKIDYRDFVRRIEYTEQGFSKAVGTTDAPRAPSEVLKMAFQLFLLEKSGINVDKLLG